MISMKKTLASLLMIPLMTISIANAQSKKYIETLKTDTTNHKVSINYKSHLSKKKSLIKNLKNSKDFQKSYFLKAEINKLNFIIDYDSLITKDKIDAAEILVKEKLSNKELGESVTGELKLYKKYKRDIEQRLIEADEKYKRIIEKKRKFKKKFNTIVKEKDLNSLEEGEDLVNHCLNYCKRNQIVVPDYLKYYKNYTESRIFDKKSNFELEKCSKSKKNLEKELEPFIKSENIEKYLKAKDFMDTLKQYVSIAPKVKLKHSEFLKERYKLIKLIEKQQELLNYDRISKNGKNYSIEHFRNDTLNPEGIFSFGNKIIVIKSFNSNSQNPVIIKGKGIRGADKILVRYADENDNSEKHSKANEKIKEDKIIPYLKGDNIKEYYYDNMGVYQIRISYNQIRNKSFTKSLIEGLKPIKLDTNFYGKVYEEILKKENYQFYRNSEGSFLKIAKKDSIIIIKDKDDTWKKDTYKEDHAIDYVHIIDKKRKKDTKYYFDINMGLLEKDLMKYKKYEKLFLRYYSLAKPNFPKTQKK